MWAEFRAFLLKTNALALAIGVIIGAALGTVVASLVNDILMPPIGMLIGGVDFRAWVFQLRGSGGETEIRYGAFIASVVQFVVVAFVVFLIARNFIKPEPAGPNMKVCPFCREQVLADATKCRYCGSTI